MKKITRILMAFIATTFMWHINAQTYSGTTGPVPASGTSGTAQFTVNVPTPGTIGVNYEIDNLTITSMNHTFDGDLDISLIAPSGEIMLLSGGNGGSGNDYIGTVFNNNGNPCIESGSPPFTGTFEPEGGLTTNAEGNCTTNFEFATVFDGATVNGVWTLNINDNFGGDSGFMNAWEITFNSLAPQPVSECGNAPLPIPAGAPGTTSGPMDPSIATVTDAGTIGGGYRIESVVLNIGHSWASDLDISLTSPGGLVIDLSTDNGGSTGLDNPADLVFTDDSMNNITGWTGGAPAADYQAEGGLMNGVFDGEPMNGDWTLNITDDAGGDFGSLNSFCINFEPVLGDPPIIVCPADIMADNDVGQCSAVVNFGTPAAIDPDGDLDVVVQTQGPPSGSAFPVGTTLVEFTAFDLAGNTASCTFNVIVSDVENPAVTCNDLIAELDENGMITIFPEDVASFTDNCPGATIEFLTSGGPAGSLSTLFAGGNGLGSGATVFYDLTVAGSPVSITGFDVNTDATSGSTVNIDVYIREGTYVGNTTNPGAWTFVGSGTGTSAGTNNPSPVTMDVPFNLGAATTYGVAINMDVSVNYTNGNGSNQNYSNADISLSLGASQAGLFSGSTFSPRVWNGTVHYAFPGPPAASIDFSCADVGEQTVTVIATDASGNVSTCTSVVTVEDNIAPVIQCFGQPGGANYLEEFEASTIPGGWTSIVEVGNWDWAFGSGVLPASDDFPTNAAIFDDDAAGPGNDNVAALYSPVFNGVGALSANLTVDVAFQEAGNQEFTIDVWDGSAWQNIAFYDEDFNPDIITESFDVLAYMNSQFQVRFRYDDLGGWGWAAGIDNFNLQIDVPSSPLVVELDENGTAVVDAEDLLVFVDEACGYTVTALGGSGEGGGCTAGVYSDRAAFDAEAGALPIEDFAGGPGGITGCDNVISETGDSCFPPGEILPGIEITISGGAGTVFVEAGNFGTTFDAVGSNTFVEYTIINFPNNDVNAFGFELYPLTAGAEVEIRIFGTGGLIDTQTVSSFPPYEFFGYIAEETIVSVEIEDLSGAAAELVAQVAFGMCEGGGPAPQVEFSCDDLGFNEVEVFVVDDSGNESMCTATVEVIDVTNPVLVCMDAVVELDENGEAEVLPEYFIDTDNSFDNCGIAITAVDVTDVTCDDIGTPITVTVFASDADGNLASCTATMTVVDALGPMIENCPEDMTVDPGPLNLFYEIPDYWASGEITATDNCTDPVTVFGQDPAPGTLLPDGVYTITIFAEDEYGNVGACTFQLTIESVLGLDDYDLENGVVLYPNPANHTVNIANATTIQLEQAVIYDINGRLIQNIDLSNMATERAVDVSNLASGVYMVQIIGGEGQTIKRLVKE